jgi:hypothetical protein
MPALLPLLVVLGAAPHSVAAPAWKTVQVPADLADFYAEHLAQALRERGLKVVTASEIATLLSMERQKQLLGCTDDAASCIAELGAALGCDATLLVSLARLEDSYQAQLKVLRSTDGSVLAETRVEASGQKALLAELDDAAARLAQGLAIPAASGEVRTSAGGAKRLWWIPAVVAGVGAAGAAVGFTVAGNTYRTLQDQLATEMSPPSADSEGLAQRGQTAQTLGWVGVGVGVAGLVGVGALLLFGDAPVQPTVALSPGGATLGFTGSLP